PIPSEEFEQAQLLAAEKEAIGLFVSAHPLKPLREALRERVDCPLSALPERREKETVTVGGIIVEAKRIRTRNGDPMMFATLDDLSAAAEILVFGNALAENEAALAVDEIVLVKGRVDHKEAGKTCLVAQSIERFAPSPEEIEQARSRARASERAAATLARPLHLCIDASALAAGALEELKQAIEDCPGAAEVVLDVQTTAGTRRLRLGDAFRVNHTATLRAELEHALASDRPRHLVDHDVHTGGRADVIPGREQMAGVQAQARAVRAVDARQQLGELPDRTPQRASRTSGVLEVNGAALALGQRLADRL